MNKKLLIFFVFNFVCLIASSDSDSEFDSIENKRMRSLEKSINLITENLALVGCIAADCAIQSYLCTGGATNIFDDKGFEKALTAEFALGNTIQPDFSFNKCNITMDILFIAARTLLPDIIEQTAGQYYRHKFIQSMFLVGFYFAPVSTVTACSAVLITKKICKMLQVPSVKSRVLEYCMGRLGGTFASLWLSGSSDIVPDANCFDCALLPKVSNPLLPSGSK